MLRDVMHQRRGLKMTRLAKNRRAVRQSFHNLSVLEWHLRALRQSITGRFDRGKWFTVVAALI